MTVMAPTHQQFQYHHHHVMRRRNCIFRVSEKQIGILAEKIKGIRAIAQDSPYFQIFRSCDFLRSRHIAAW